jgi:hypothetical protein
MPTALHLALVEHLGRVDVEDRDGQDFELSVDLPHACVAPWGVYLR